MNETLLQSILINDLLRIKELIDEGANPNYINDIGDTPLLVAIKNNNLEAATILLQNKANPDLVEGTYTSPLIEAIDTSVQITLNDPNEEAYPIDMIKLLIKYGATIFLEDKEGETPYQFAQGYHPFAMDFFNTLNS